MNVFKYRGGDLEIFERDLFALEHNYFWGAKIDDLNDPCEALILSDKINQQLDALKFIVGKKKEGSLKEVKEAFLKVIETNKKLGVYSLSKTYKDELLWAHYAYSHFGFCIEFDLEILKGGYRNKLLSFDVKYKNEPPEINIGDISSRAKEIFNKLVGFKSKRWEYEEEYRIITDFSGEYFYPPNAVKSIYFGVRTTEKNKEKIKEVLRGRGIKFYQIIQKEKSYKFDCKLIEDSLEENTTYLRKFDFGDFEIEMELYDTKYADLIKRGDIVIKINKILNKSEIEDLSNYLREQLFFKSERLLIQIYQKDQKDDMFNWANANYLNGKWNISINEFVL
ncbi:DUF2971 domain-containing protein [Galbibacter orientalis]|uniref:DUF2971 domain-containing protein n=1 Tax=Galbibacter orientalis TaxID=453852 RepID=UPI003080A31C